MRKRWIPLALLLTPAIVLSEGGQSGRFAPAAGAKAEAASRRVVSRASETTMIAQKAARGGSATGKPGAEPRLRAPSPATEIDYQSVYNYEVARLLPSFTQPVTVTVTNSTTNSAITAGSTQYITASPAMPTISAQAQGSGVCSVQWSLAVSYTRPDGSGTNTDTFGPETTTGSTAWVVPWNGNFRGGTATLSWSINSSANGSLTFSIAGSNPSYSAIDTNISSRTPPWFFTRMVSKESSYRQFDNGVPLYSNDKGYGLTQVTTSNAQDLWNWMGNITAGLAVLNGKKSGAQSFWQSQITQWQDYNSGRPAQQQLGPPQDNNAGGPCLFAYPIRSGTYGYDDANWIKSYNGATRYFAYIVVPADGSPAYWVNDNDTSIINGVVTATNYVHGVCQAQVL